MPTDEQAESLMVASARSLDETCLVHGAPQVAAAKTAQRWCAFEVNERRMTALRPSNANAALFS